MCDACHRVAIKVCVHVYVSFAVLLAEELHVLLCS